MVGELLCGAGPLEGFWDWVRPMKLKVLEPFLICTNSNL